MSGNFNFPFFHGMIDKRCFTIEYLSSSETLKTQLSEQNCPVKWNEVCLGIVRAIYSTYLKGIIHNDIHCKNILIRKRKYVKLIDFGKCTLTEDPVTYRVKSGSASKSFTTSISVIWHMKFVMYQARKCVLKLIFIQLVMFLAKYQTGAN